MTKFKLIAAAVVLSATIAAPSFAQEAISEPGMYAFYHPNADVTAGARPGPSADAMASVRSNSAMASAPARHVARSSAKTDARTAAAGQ
jgi:hypothetical protein